MDLDSRSMQMDIVDKTEPVSNARNIGFGLGMAMARLLEIILISFSFKKLNG